MHAFAAGAQFHHDADDRERSIRRRPLRHLLNLRSDPTHSLLYPHQWWSDQFKSVGFDTVDARIAFVHDNTFYELSDCQIILTREAVDKTSTRALRTTTMTRPEPYR